MNDFSNKSETAQEWYQTGRTRPPKSYGGVIAFLLILVIFLSGIVTMLSMMNIRLFRMVENQDLQDISLLARCAPAQQETAADYGDHQATLGITGQEITEFYQSYYSIPQGVYVTQVESDSDCYAKGLRSGDILTHFNGTPITSSHSLRGLLQATSPGDSASLTIYRSGTQHQITVILGTTE